MREFQEKISIWTFWLVIVISGIALIGWLTNVLSLAGMGKNSVPMAPVTILCFMLTGFAGLNLQQKRLNPILLRILLFSVLCICLIILIDSITGYPIEFEHIISNSRGLSNNFPIGRMSPVSSILFLIGVVTLLIITTKDTWHKLGIILSTAALFAAFTFDLGYLYGSPLLYGRSIIPPAWNTSVAFTFLFTAILSGFGTKYFPLKLFVGESVRAKLMRNFLPLTLLIIIIAGWIDTIFMHVYNDHVLVSAFVTILSLFVLSFILLKLAKRVGNDIDQAFALQKKAEESLTISEKRYRDLIETMPDGVYRSTPEGKFKEVNQAMVKMLGYDSKEELMAIDIKTQLYFDPADRESIVLQEKLEEMGIFRMKKKDGTEVWVEDHGWYLTDETDKVIFHEGIARDITERKMNEIQIQKYSEELQEMNSTKDKFFSIIAHDLKSPFNSIMGLSGIIKNEAKNLDITTIEQYAEVIHSTSSQTYRLLENLLDWARIQQSQITFRPVSIVLNEVITEVFGLMIEKSTSKNIKLTNLVPDQLRVSADEDMLKTIIRNLVSNALKFTPTNGNIEIKAMEKPDEIEIAIKDTGIGIKKEDIDKLFKIGSNYSQQGTENESGTGLGLVLCKEFVEKHSGKIWVESEEGKGSTFKFTLHSKL